MNRRISLLALTLLAAGCSHDSTSDRASAASDESPAIATQQVSEAVCTRVRLQLHQSGRLDVLDAAEQPGTCRASRTLAGDYLYEVYKDGVVVAAGGFMDPFEERGAETGPEGGSLRQLESGEVVIKVPGLTLTSTGFSIKIRRMTEASIARGAKSPQSPLTSQGGARPTPVLADFGELSATDLAALLRGKGRRLSAHGG
jgi:hypothetical protein